MHNADGNGSAQGKAGEECGSGYGQPSRSAGRRLPCLAHLPHPHPHLYQGQNKGLWCFAEAGETQVLLGICGTFSK